MNVRHLAPREATYRRHPLHATDRTWTETNCYVDLWIEVLHWLGLDPVAAMAFTLSADFEGDQWTFIKYPPSDMREIYGIDVAEMSVWRSVLEHTNEHLTAGRLVTVEVDAWWLPDTAATSYRTEHVKTTIVPQRLDVRTKHLGYFHNAGYFELDGADFTGLFAPQTLPPYMELVKLDHIRRGEVIDRALELTSQHLERRAPDAIARMMLAVETDIAWLRSGDLDTFHRYAFATIRQCGVTAELAASYIDWLDDQTGRTPGSAAASFRAVSEAAKGLEFGLARVARGRTFDLFETRRNMENNWEQAMDEAARRYAS